MLGLQESGDIALPDSIVQLLSVKRLANASYLSHIAYYFARKAEGINCATHPIVAALVRTRQFLTALRPIADPILIAAKDILNARSSTGNAGADGTTDSDKDSAKRASQKKKSTTLAAADAAEPVIVKRRRSAKDWSAGADDDVDDDMTV